MSIKDQLTVDMKEAMKDRENGKLRLNVIRMVRANIKNVEINDKKELNDDEVLAVLMKEVKNASRFYGRIPKGWTRRVGCPS